MKKIYTVMVISIFTGYGILNAQVNILKGSAMEKADESEWSISYIANDDANTVDYIFGFSADTPSEGVGNCLYIIGNNASGTGTHIMFYQEVTLEKGIPYVFDYAFKTLIDMEHFWIESYLGPDEPEEGVDYVLGNYPDAMYLGGFKAGSDWGTSCDISIDGTLAEDVCDGTFDTILIEGTGEITLFLGIKTGVWDYPTGFEIVVDEVTLTAQVPASVHKNSLSSSNIYPYLENGILKFTTELDIKKISILNMLGQTLISDLNNLNALDVSSLNAGIYIARLIDSNNNISIVKFKKN